jgi:hypothetical protein
LLGDFEGVIDRRISVLHWYDMTPSFGWAEGFKG